MIEMMIGMALAKDKSLGQLQTHDLMLVPQVNDLAAGAGTRCMSLLSSSPNLTSFSSFPSSISFRNPFNGRSVNDCKGKDGGGG
jgi:hypothetical protein